MSKIWQEKTAARGHPRARALTYQSAAQILKAAPVRTDHLSFSPLQRCARLEGISLPAQTRLAGSKNPAALRGKIYRS